MNWFSWLVIGLAAAAVAYSLYLLVRPRRPTVDGNARLREKYEAEDFYRGGNRGVSGFKGGPGGDLGQF